VEGHLEGTPQGASVSPLLSLLTLRDFLSQAPSVSYVDDAFFYGNRSFKVADDPNSGVHIHPSKSGWVKKDGRWLKPLKFLGLEFDGRMFSASTRKGSRLIYTSSVKTALKQIDEKLALLSSTGLSENVKTEYTWDAVFKSKYIG